MKTHPSEVVRPALIRLALLMSASGIIVHSVQSVVAEFPTDSSHLYQLSPSFGLQFLKLPVEHHPPTAGLRQHLVIVLQLNQHSISWIVGPALTNLKFDPRLIANLDLPKLTVKHCYIHLAAHLLAKMTYSSAHR